MESTELLPAEAIEQRILLVRGQKVMLDSALAELYPVPTKVLNQAVKRNLDRFPEDFMFRLTPDEANRSQIVTGSWRLAIFRPKRGRLALGTWRAGDIARWDMLQLVRRAELAHSALAFFSSGGCGDMGPIGGI